MNLFFEKQALPRWIVIIIMPGLIISLVVVGALLYSNGVKIDAGKGDLAEQKELWQSLWIIVGVNEFTLWFVLLIKFIITVTIDSIKISYLPFVRKKIINSPDIESCEPITYSPLGDAGGYGVKSSKKYGKVYNANGNKGIFIRLKTGKKLLIGTQRQDALLYAIKKMMNHG
jgi:hypothetical protein